MLRWLLIKGLMELSFLLSAAAVTEGVDAVVRRKSAYTIAVGGVNHSPSTIATVFSDNATREVYSGNRVEGFNSDDNELQRKL